MWLKHCSLSGSGTSRRQTHSVLIFCAVCIFLVSERIWLRSSWTARCCSLHLMLFADKYGTKRGQKRRRKRKRKWVGRWNLSHPAALHFLLFCPVTHRRGRDQRATKWRSGLIALNRPVVAGQGPCWWREDVSFFPCSLPPPPPPLGVNLQEWLEWRAGGGRSV